MNIFTGTKTNRKKLPNLIDSIQKNKTKNSTLPRFFYKIQNSLTLLQQPMRAAVQEKQKSKQSSHRNTISVRLRQLSKHKDKSSTISKQKSIGSYNTITSPKKTEQVSIKQICKIKFLPRMNTGFSNPNNSKQISEKQFNFTTYNSIQTQHHTKRAKNTQNHRRNFSSFKQLQFIQSTSLVRKTYKQIIEEKQRRQEEEQRKKILSFRLDNIDDNDDEQNNQKLNKQKSPSENQLNNIANQKTKEQNLTQWSQRIVADQYRLYDTYDKKLMEKIKIYRPKKFKFSHQAQWK